MSIKETILSRRLNQQLDCANLEKWIEIRMDFWADYIAALVALQTQVWRDTAEGVWLDRIGEIVGVTRPPEEEVIRVFRCAPDDSVTYDENHGWSDLGSESIGGLLWDYGGIPSPSGGEATDETFNDFISAKIAATNADASIPGIARYIQDAYGIDCTITVGTRVVYIELDEAIDLRKRRFLELFMPVVAGVDFVITNWPDYTEV